MGGRKVVILLYQISVIVKGIERKLNESGYTAMTLLEDFDRISSLAEETDLFLLYLPAGIMDDEAKCRNLAKILELIGISNSKLVIIGEKNDHSEITKHYAAAENYSWLDRPIDFDVLIKTIDNTIEGSIQIVPKKRVLIVDDDPSYASMVREWIRDNYHADIVVNGMQAITFLVKHKVDLVLLDYEMPVVDGPQVLQMLRQEPDTAHIPVIFLTGNGTKEAVSRVMELKPDGYVLKSTTKADLLAYLKKKL